MIALATIVETGLDLLGMFSKLKVQNFKAIGPDPVEIGLAPVTVLVGENGAGKSSMLQALALTAQSATDDQSYNELIPSGSKIDLQVGDSRASSLRAIYHGKSVFEPMSVEVEMDVAPLDLTPIGDRRAQEAMLGGQVWWPDKTIGYRWQRCEAKAGRRVAWEHEVFFDGASAARLWTETKVAESGASSYFDKCRLGSVDIQNWQGSFSQVWPETLFSPYRALEPFLQGTPQLPLARAFAEIGEKGALVFKNVHFLSALRGASLAHRDPGPDVRFVGKNAELLIRVLNNVSARTSDGFAKLREWAKRFDLPDLEGGTTDGNLIKAVFRDPHTKEVMDVDEASSGAHQGLVLASQVFLTPRGATLLIEEPENNMHPAWEKLLPELFADSAASGHQVIVTTHSEVLVAALGLAVRKGVLENKDVAIWHLVRDADGARAESIDVSKRGNLYDWVRSFARVEEELSNEWFDKLPE
jgi:predicted ATPase